MQPKVATNVIKAARLGPAPEHGSLEQARYHQGPEAATHANRACHSFDLLGAPTSTWEAPLSKSLLPRFLTMLWPWRFPSKSERILFGGRTAQAQDALRLSYLSL